MSTNPSLSKERVLLNLKWFVTRVVKSFELKLETVHNSVDDPKTIFGLRSRSFAKNSLPTGRPFLATDVPIKRKSYQSALFGPDYTEKSSFIPRSGDELASPARSLKGFLKSPRLLFHQTKVPSQKRTNSSGDLTGHLRKIPFASSCQSPEQYEMESNFSSVESNISQMSSFSIDPSRRLRLVVLLESTTRDERHKALLRFAEHLCVVYEYQLGMLRGLKSIYAAADYVVDVVLRAFKTGIIQSLTPLELNPSLLFECRPSSASRLVKTVPMTVTGEQLTWRLGDMWVLPGLRHNEVGGENCHNLSIVTHFLSRAETKSTLRPDTYGYRNLLCLPANEDAVTLHFDLFALDHQLVTTNGIRTGCKGDDRPYRGVKRDESTLQAKTMINSASTLRQYLHRAYRPIFFVILERPSVLEHLTECDSFAKFSAKQSIHAVMYVNQETQLFQGNSHSSLYHNFNLFEVSSNENREVPTTGKCSGLTGAMCQAQENQGFVC
ncbi:hypothetical protein Ciccas_007069 [Cichlidogyrus casuarinus]|uniref:Uncharacterized protein n=1 Tax=Cichlidogyrus casuarinus TaxID=1844966 RepID=A0ABD2Q3X8_9PLAT